MGDQRLKVILAENPESGDGSVKGFLERRNVILFPCSDGLDVIRAAYSKGPDLIIMGTDLPRMNGYQCSRVLRHEPVTRDVPILHIGRAATPIDRYWSKICQADAYLSLPVNHDELESAIRSLLARTRPRRRLLPPMSIVPNLEDRDILALAGHLLEHDLLISSVLNEIGRIDAWSLSSKDLVASLLAIIHSLFPFSCGAGLLIFEKHSELYVRPQGGPETHDAEKMLLVMRGYLRDRHDRYLDPADVVTTFLPPGPAEPFHPAPGDIYVHTKAREPIRSVLAFENLNPEDLPGEERHVLHLALETAHSVMEKKILSATAQELSVIDETTRGYSLAFFMEVLTRELLNARRNQYPVTLFTLLILNFRDILSALSDEDRPALYKGVHGAILRTMRKTDIVARRTDAEFLFLLTHTTRENAAIPAQRVKANIMEDVRAGCPGLPPPTIFMGAAQFDPARHPTAEALLQEAYPRRAAGLGGEDMSGTMASAGGVK